MKIDSFFEVIMRVKKSVVRVVDLIDFLIEQGKSGREAISKTVEYCLLSENEDRELVLNDK
jgi:hypothetical protein